MKKVYICGSIKNNKNYIREFTLAEILLMKNGYIVLNPVVPRGISEKEAMILALNKMFLCDIVCPINDYRESKGVEIELLLAKYLGIPIVKLKKLVNKKKNF